MGGRWVRACSLHGGSTPCRPSLVRAPSSLPVALDRAPALRICRVESFIFMMETGPGDWGNLLLTNGFQLVH